MGVTFNHMVESSYAQEPYIDSLFHSLADPIRRDILRRLTEAEQTVSQIAARYEVSLAAVSKHLKVLESARLVSKQRRGKEQVVSIEPTAIADASEILRRYESLINTRYDTLDKLLQEKPHHGKS
jgi:DNA-binding transcriptional ArsR family regulator